MIGAADGRRKTLGVKTAGPEAIASDPAVPTTTRRYYFTNSMSRYLGIGQ
jgi:hypothetical protein